MIPVFVAASITGYVFGYRIVPKLPDKLLFLGSAYLIMAMPLMLAIIMGVFR